MDRYLLRHLATSYTGRRVAAAHFERTVLIWDIVNGRIVAQFQTGLDFGGRRLAISPDGETCVVGAYYIYGIAGYAAITGAERWCRRELKKVQYVTLSADGQRVYCCFDARPCHVLDLATGATLALLRGVRNVYESPFEDVRLLDKARPELQKPTGEHIAFVDYPPSTILTAAFGPEMLCISGGRGPARCFETRTGQQLWECTPNAGTTLLTVAYATERGQFVGVEWPHQRRGAKRLVGLAETVDRPYLITTIDEPAETEFCSEGNLLVTTSGALISTATGSLVRTLPVGGADV